jgi:hypothetical protein
MADAEIWGLDDELPEWAEEDLHDIPPDDPADLLDPGAPLAAPPLFAAADEPPPGGRDEGLPRGVSLLERGEARYFTQRVTAPPLADCMFAALCVPLSFVGYDLPPTFVGALRAASGVPVLDPRGHPQGTNTAASRRALHELLPDAPILFGALSDGAMLGQLEAGEIAVRVMVSNQKLPERMRRFVGRTWDGLHAIAIGGAHRDGGQLLVRWMDPAGRPWQGYDGEFVSYGEVDQALVRTADGKIRVTFGRRDAALPDRQRMEARARVEPGARAEPEEQPKQEPGEAGQEQAREVDVRILTNGKTGEVAGIRRGTAFLHPETGERVTRASRDDNFRLAGRSLDGRFAGVWVNTSRVQGASGATLLLVDADAIGEPFKDDGG